MIIRPARNASILATFAVVLLGFTVARQPADVLGTVEAVVDGAPQTWYIVTGDAQDGPYASGVWMEAEGDRTVVFGGLDEAEPGVEQFTRKGPAGPSLGSYAGSALNIMVRLSPEGTGRYPVGEESRNQVLYLPDATVMDPAGMFTMTEGVVDIEAVEVDGDAIHARGTFSGRLERMSDGTTMDFTEGRFEVRDLPNVQTVQPR